MTIESHNRKRHSIPALPPWTTALSFCLVLNLGIITILGSSGDLDLDEESALLWHNNLDGVGTSPAIGSDGTIYAGSTDNRLRAFAPDGKLKWSYETDDVIRSSPAIGNDGTIYIGSSDSYLRAINPDGSLKWDYETGGPIDSSPAIGSDGTIYVGSDDSLLHAINPDGSFKWDYVTGGTLNSSPAVDCDGNIYIGSSDSYLRAINPDGSLKWRYATGDSIDSSPSIGSDGIVYVGSNDGKLYAINPGDGSLKWSVPFPSDLAVTSSPAIGSDGKVYALTRDLRVINPDGSVEDTITLYKDVAGSSPMIQDGVLYTSTTSILAYEIPSMNLADSPWPVFRNDLKHTGRVACDSN